MPTYHALGRLPPKRHTALRGDDGALRYEELVGNKGFTGPSSLLYHLRLPTAVKSVRAFRDLAWETEEDRTLRHRHFRTAPLETGPSAVLDRVPLLFNADVALQMVRPQKEDAFFYRNGQGDEVVFVTEGEGVLESSFGVAPVPVGGLPGDPARDPPSLPPGSLPPALPRHREPRGGEHAAGATATSTDSSSRARRTRSATSAVRRASQAHDETGDFRLIVKAANRLTEIVLAHHPFDVVGWDGYYYPWAFNIHDFEPKVGRVHLPPPVHQTFEGDGFVVCSFCPRPFDFDKDAVPAPYSHQNVMSDEVLYYANAEFMSRKGIEYGSITLHPDGLPHGPQPGKTEESIGAKWTNELAVMVDTFKPLRASRQALPLEDEGYSLSWLT